ncbi:MAG TPA: ERCC4 domain-containing protein [Candidatus Nanoarchaeia archaeon]|nr:ERCC4 domain-containing protein [Candidatus Nanoarchaeia archaeon]
MIYDIFNKPSKKIYRKKLPKIIIDFREKNSLIPTKLQKLNHEIELKELKVADYLINNTAIERKTTADFIQSMINGRLKKQLQEIKQYPQYLLVIEGDLTQTKFQNQNALRGFLISITLNQKIPTIFTKNEEETATYISLLSKRKSSPSKVNPKKSNLSKKEQLEYILQAFPKIGPKKSKELLKKFKTLKNIFQEKEENLKPILNKNAFQFISLLNSKYD